MQGTTRVDRTGRSAEISGRNGNGRVRDIRALPTGTAAIALNSFKREEEALPERLAFSIAEVVLMVGCGRTSVHAHIRAGTLRAHKLGRRTIVLRQDLKEFLSALPRTEHTQP